MSAWKKPSRMACFRKARITVRPSALRSRPAAASRATSAIGMPSIHSTVSTRRAVRFQSTSGTRKSASPLMFSAISEMAAASSRRSISISVGAPQRVDDGDRLQAPRGRMKALDLARGEVVAVEVAAEALLDAGAQDLDGDLRAGVRRRRRRPPCAPGRWRRRRPAGRTPRSDPRACRRAPARPRARASAMRERRQLVLQVRQVARELWADHVGARCQELAELDVAGAEACQGGGEARLRAAHRHGTALQPSAIGSRQRGARGAAPSGTGTPSGTKRTPCWASTSTGPARGADCW